MIEVGWVASTLVLVTGPVWARPVWGQWWNWEPRLTSFAFLWLLYAAYQILGPAIPDRDKRRTLQSAYAILAFVSVPIVVYSTRFLPESEQLHPVTVELSPKMIAAWGLSLAALTLLFAGLTQLRYRIECLADAAHDLRVSRWTS